MRDYIIVALISYLCGSIPFGYILVRIFKGQDVRQSGSGNIGATNVARTSPALGITTLILDATKGFAPVVVTVMLFVHIPEYRSSSGHEAEYLVAYRQEFLVGSLACLAAVVGHMFPVWLRFRGGKGVATAVGGFAFLYPSAIGVSVVVFALACAAFRFVSLGSLFSSLVFPFAAVYFNSSYLTPITIVIIAACSLLIILKHHSNIRRLLNGTEDKFGRNKSAEALAQED